MGFDMLRSDINDTEDLMYDAQSQSKVNLLVHVVNL